MKLIYQKSWFCSVKRIHSGELLAEASVLGTELEATGRLKADQSSFEIKDARWEVFRSPAGIFNGSQEAPGLKGTTAYFNAGRDLRREVGEHAGGLARELLAECVKGIIQSETFLFRERGFPTLKSYCEHWRKFQVDTCRYQSNLHRVTRWWNEYVDGLQHGLNLFNRSKNCAVYLLADGLIVHSGFSDSYHELGLLSRLDLAGRVEECSGSFLRAPDQVCFECALLPGRLKGLVLTECAKKQLSEIVGGPQGCEHLVDLAEELRKAVAYTLANIRKGGVV
ncbi:hypothetical protein Psfp_00087 [Pelotomaculum sp. FP]|uniref:DUF2889 domain-containing protein n=1 Tax=Pelotomaculum sp. FP TaxID=261474 RepID=UPI001066C417|nr:DUF2889 domain-containing protein [Pelotomaculum sp. FP]TEB17964.1 hypothetical protein Psfp_00087 [Pelotomaculum sp. FP]